MNYSIRYTPQAQTDIETVWDNVYEASKNFDIADDYVDNLQNKISKKKSFPNSGIPLIYKGLFTGIYSINYKAYKAFYRVNGKYVEILRVLLSKRDYIKILFKR